MGYSVYNLKSDVFVPNEKKPGALAALLAVDEDSIATSLEQQLAALEWQAVNDDEGNVVDLLLDDNRLHEESENALATIAPFVRPGSFVMFVGEDSALFGWEFVEIDGVVTAVERDVEPVFIRPVDSTATTESKKTMLAEEAEEAMLDIACPPDWSASFTVGEPGLTNRWTR